MASRNFEINTEPHVANIGPDQLLFRPEVIGVEFAAGYDKLVKAQERVNAGKAQKATSSKPGKAQNIDTATLVELNDAMRDFLSGLMVPDSATKFATMQLPDRILVQLLQWTAELYGGGGSGNGEDGGSSSD